MGPIIATIGYDGFIHEGNTDMGNIIYCVDWPFIRRGCTDISPIAYTVDVDGFIHLGNTDMGPIIYTLSEI